MRGNMLDSLLRKSSWQRVDTLFLRCLPTGGQQSPLVTIVIPIMLQLTRALSRVIVMFMFKHTLYFLRR